MRRSPAAAVDARVREAADIRLGPGRVAQVLFPLHDLRNSPGEIRKGPVVPFAIGEDGGERGAPLVVQERALI